MPEPGSRGSRPGRVDGLSASEGGVCFVRRLSVFLHGGDCHLEPGAQAMFIDSPFKYHKETHL